MGWGYSFYLYKEFDVEIKFLLYMKQLMEIDSNRNLFMAVIMRHCDPSMKGFTVITNMEDEDNLFPYFIFGYSRKHFSHELLVGHSMI